MKSDNKLNVKTDEVTSYNSFIFSDFCYYLNCIRIFYSFTFMCIYIHSIKFNINNYVLFSKCIFIIRIIHSRSRKLFINLQIQNIFSYQ